MTSRLLCAATLLGLGSLTCAQNPYTPVENNNRLIVLQRVGSDSTQAADVRVKFYGHASFKITSAKGVSVLFDPWRNDLSGSWGKWYLHEFPAIPVDIVVSTHAHFDHDAVERPHAQMVFERPIGDFKLGDVELIGLAEKHQCHSEGDLQWDSIATELGISLCPPDNVIAFDNTIQILETGGLRIAVWGDNRPSPAPDLDKYLRNVDVLILPIDGSQHILTYAEVDEIIQRYSPKAIIPAHYLTAGAESVLSGLKSADSWVESQKSVRRIDRDEVVFNRAELKGASHRVYYFGNHYAKE